MTPYAAWVAGYVADRRDVTGRCRVATAELVATFPELRRVHGLAHGSWGSGPHFWCVAPDGEVVDPTAAQFGTGLVYETVPWLEQP